MTSIKSWGSKVKGLLLKAWGTSLPEAELFFEKPLPANEVWSILVRDATPSFNFYVLLMISATIATLGLLADNSVIIIGAMIISPLMNPIVGLSYTAISVGKHILFRASFTLVSGIIVTIATAYLVTILVGTKVVGTEVAARIEPNLLDLGVAIASGAVAGIAYVRKNVSNTLPGVAIAVALVPPLCVTGIGFALGDKARVDSGLYYGRVFSELYLSSGSFFLFIINLAGIILCAGLVFLLHGYGKIKRSLICLPIIALIISVFSLPLYNQLENFLLRDKVVELIDNYSRENTDKYEWIERSKGIDDIYVEQDDEHVFVLMNAIVPRDAVSKKDHDDLEKYLSKRLAKKVNIELHLLFYDSIVEKP